ncbi:hypothetical protein C8R43DRAFT_1009689 [Mycena crocata]|nr:hypothetical protein C8R43DRAFT_1009689 [Mycena crocata]
MTIDISDSDSAPMYGSEKQGEPKETTGTTSEPRYIHYRVYAPDGSLLSKSAGDSGRPFIGRIPARSVPPPHTVASLKRCIVNAEKLSDLDGSRTSLYLTPDAQSALTPGSPARILGPGGVPGSTPETAYALVVLEELTPNETADVDSLAAQVIPGEVPKYLYYHLFTRVGEEISKAAFDPDEPAKGRVDKIQVAPPYTAESIKRAISKIEGKRIWAYAELYAEIAAQAATVDRAYIPLSRDDSPGSTFDKPLVIVQPERRPGLINRPIRVISNAGLNPSFFPNIGARGYSDGTTTRTRRGNCRMDETAGLANFGCMFLVPFAIPMITDTFCFPSDIPIGTQARWHTVQHALTFICTILALKQI